MRRRTARAACGLAMASLLTLPIESAHAQPFAPDGGAEAGRTSPVVVLVVIGGGRDGAGLLDTVRELLGRLGLVVEAHTAAGAAEAAAIPRGSAAARVEVDLGDPREAVIRTDGRLQAPRQRTLHRDPSPAVAHEELAQAIQSAVESQLFADPAGGPVPPPTDAPPGVDAGAGPGSASSPSPPPPEAPPAAPSPALPAPPSASPPAPSLLAAEAPTRPRKASALAVDVSPLAGGGGFSAATGPVVAFGGDVTVASRRGWRPSVALSAREILPFEGTQDSVTFHASALAARALGGVELVGGTWIALVAGAGGGADVVWVQPRSAVLASSVLGAASTRVDPIVSAFVGAHVALFPSMSLTVLALGDLDLAPPRYVVLQGAAVDSVLSPWRLRPTLLAGFTFTALGQPRFAARDVR